jgi:hypothetical protein
MEVRCEEEGACDLRPEVGTFPAFAERESFSMGMACSSGFIAARCSLELADAIVIELRTC